MANESTVLNFSICFGGVCDTMTFTESTGAYHVTTNPTGWESVPTITTGTVTLSILFPDEDDAEVVDLEASYPVSNTTNEYSITTDSLGVTSFPDGVYTITYTVVADDATTWTRVKQFCVTCNAECCVDNMFGELDLSDCNCDTKRVQRALLAYATLKALKFAGRVGDTTKFATLLEDVETLCGTDNNCTTCN